MPDTAEGIARESAPPRSAWVTAVYSGKGGVGRTTIALNVAVALAQQGASVALVDLDLQYGDIAAAIEGPPNPTTIADLVSLPPDEIDLALVRAALHPGPAGIQLLAAPLLPELADLAESHRGAVQGIVRLLAGAFDHVVVDLGRFMGETGASVIEACDRVILVTTALSISLKDVRRADQLLRRLGLPGDRVFVVLNRVDEHANFNQAELEATLGHPLHAVLPHDSRVAVDALDAGQPLVLSRPTSALARSLARLAAEIGTEARIAMKLAAVTQQAS